MIETKNIQNIYFIGIGGIGMSALARYFHSLGATVGGYDKTPTTLTREMEAAGMHIHYTEDIEQAPAAPNLVVYTPAIPAQHAELVHYRATGVPVLKRSEVLGIITRSSFNICVAGTHGKTTISTMVSHILRHSGYGCNAFLGGIAVNYGTNFWGSERNVCVIEADEYDRSFLQLSPDVAVVTAMDADHLDIYGTAEAMEEAFIQFTGKIKPGGLLINNHSINGQERLTASKKQTYGKAGSGAEIYPFNITTNNGSYRFSIQFPGSVIDNVVLNIGGMHNVENLVAAISAVRHLGITDEQVREAAAAFRGVKRRFEYIIKTPELVMVDDYAHHPEELRALIGGARSLFPGKKLVAVFQPHLFTRTRDLAAGFAETLSLADEVVLLPIYPARELPIAGVSSEMILDQVTSGKKMMVEKEALAGEIAASVHAASAGAVVLMAGAGDIDLLVEPVKQALTTTG
ncbi:MAG: UDP-N-acetylmuramate--L-alanine ligase [Dinghuibacter sp.]|nr:UDP-N-acetylmuramate--L-alanine ligase [Dinghuibacter sp.]